METTFKLILSGVVPLKGVIVRILFCIHSAEYASFSHHANAAQASVAVLLRYCHHAFSHRSARWSTSKWSRAKRSVCLLDLHVVPNRGNCEENPPCQDTCGLHSDNFPADCGRGLPLHECHKKRQRAPPDAHARSPRFDFPLHECRKNSAFCTEARQPWAESAGRVLYKGFGWVDLLKVSKTVCFYMVKRTP